MQRGCPHYRGFKVHDADKIVDVVYDEGVTEGLILGSNGGIMRRPGATESGCANHILSDY